ncbi:hypothetical protein H4R19_001566, partial [Coemansia spiralis]
MSSRAVRRFLKERGYDDLSETSARIERNAPAPADATAGSDDDGEASAGGAQGNMFDLLMGGEASGGETSDGEASDGGADEDSRGPTPARAKPAAAAKKGKKGRGGKGQAAKAAKGKGKKDTVATADDMSMAEFETQLESARQQAAASAADTARDAPRGGKGKDGSGHGEALGVVLSEEQQRNRALLVVDAKYLDSEAEIKRLFGSAVLKGDEPAAGGGRRRVARRPAPKRLTLSHPKATWPPVQV